MKSATDILVIDDQLEHRLLIEELLEAGGYRVRSFGSGEEALCYLKSNRPGLIICDIRMPGMDGFEVLEAIKSDYPDIGIVMLTGDGDSEAVREAFRMGADEFITKPIDSEELLLVVERVIWQFAALLN